MKQELVRTGLEGSALVGLLAQLALIDRPAAAPASRATRAGEQANAQMLCQRLARVQADLTQAILVDRDTLREDGHDFLPFRRRCLNLQQALAPREQALLEGYGSFARGMAYAHTGRLDQAKAELASVKRLQNLATALLRKAADIDDELGNDPLLLGGGARLALARALMQSGKADEASREIAKALRLNGPSAWTHQGLAQLAKLRGARDESLRQAALARL